MKECTDEILDAALALAAEGGFENVRQREVAARAGVALGTLYKRFRSKEDILAAAMARDAELLERHMERHPATGGTPQARVNDVFRTMTARLVRRPHYARAVLRAISSGVPEIASKVIAYYARMAGLVIAAARGQGRLGYVDATTTPPGEPEQALAMLLLQLWYAALIGWSGGLFDQAAVDAQMERATRVVWRGLDLG